MMSMVFRVERKEGWLWGRKQVRGAETHCSRHSALLQVGTQHPSCKLVLQPMPRVAPQVDHWVLVDAGQADTVLFGGHASSLVRAVKRALAPPRRGAPPGRLDAIVLTHAHAVGALPKLLQTYPDTVVRGRGRGLGSGAAVWMVGEVRSPP